MKKQAPRIAALSLAAFVALPAVAAGPFLLTPDQQDWKADKPTQRQEIHADAAYRVTTRRVRIAPGQELPPHGHDKGYRLVTVISGTLLLGFGDRFDETALKTLPPGSVFSEPAGKKHFARTLGEPVVLQLTEVLSEVDGLAGKR